MKKHVFKLIAVVLCASIVLCFARIDLNKDNSGEFERFSESVTTLIQNAESDNAYSVSKPDYSTHRLIVKAKGSIDTLNAVDVADGYNDLHILQFDSESSAESAFEYYSTLDGVSYVQPDRIRTTLEMKSEQYEGMSTAPDAELHKLDSEYCGITPLRSYLNDNNITYSRQIVVAVVDTGVEDDHELLDGRIIPNENNYSSDIASSSYDNNGHGTHVAGIIINNTLDNVSVKPYKVLDEKGKGSDMQCYLGIMAAVDDGVDVINMSFGGPGDSELMSEAIEKADSQGIVCVAAAGNDGVCMDGKNSHYSPACIKQCITVMAASSSENKPTREESFMWRMGRLDFSNYGACCDFLAPGYYVKSSYLGNTYKSLCGTSMAAPFVSAAATYVLFDKPDLSPAEVCQRMKDYSVNYKDSNALSFSNASSLYVEYITRTMQKLNAPQFSVTTGTFDEDFFLELSTDWEDAVIAYHLSTSADRYWQTYTKPIKIHNNITVTAYVVRIGQFTSDTVEHTYTRTYSADESKYVITDSGEITEYMYGEEESELVIPDTINSIVPTSIASNVFSNREFETVYIPNSVKTISKNAFYNCKKLESVVANGVENLSGFSGCSSLVVIECDSLKNLNAGAFTNCTSLTHFDLSNITRIERGTFSGCTGITSVVSDKIEYIGPSAFAGSGVYTIFTPNLTEVDTKAFYEEVNLCNVFAERLEKIGNYAFSQCTALESVTLENVKSIGTEAFFKSVLKDVHLPSLITLATSNSAFSSCKELEVFDAPILKTLGETSLSYCTSLKTIILPSLSNMNNCKNCFIGCTALESAYFPELTSITAKFVFDNCTNLKAIYAPSLASTAYLPNIDNVSIYLSDSFTSCSVSSSNTYCIAAPAGSYAQQWAENAGYSFVDCNNSLCTGVADDAYIYTSSDSDAACTMPADIVEYMWDLYTPINKTPDFITHGFLLDTVSDGYINAKDFARINNRI